MDGFEVLRRLRANDATKDLPVVLLTAMPADRGEIAALGLGTTHYITKPWEPGTVELAIKVALQEAEVLNNGVSDSDPSAGSDPSAPIRTGNMQIDQKLSGGIQPGSLASIEGVPLTGKSVLSQHMTYESLVDGYGVAYFTSEHTGNSLVSQMGSLGREVSAYYRDGRFGVYPLDESDSSGGPEHLQDPERLMGLLALDIGDLPRQYKVIIVDSITDLATRSRKEAIMSFFFSCRRLCDDGQTIVIVSRSYAFDESMLKRLQIMCDVHLSLRVEKIGAKMVKTLEVRKVDNAELTTGNTVSFEVAEGIGMRIVPGAKVRV